MKISFEPAARNELEDIFEWIVKDNPRAASEMIARIEAKIMRLAAANLAYMGRLGFVEGTRELIEYPYIIVYRVDDDRQEVIVVSIVHGARSRENRE